MSAEENKATVRRAYDEGWNQGHIAVFDDLLATDFIQHRPPPQPPADRETLKHAVVSFRAAFPDLHIAVDDMIAEGEKVVVRMTMRGTHRAEFMGMPPTGNSINVPGIVVLRMANGKAAESWIVLDSLGMMQQLGAIPGRQSGTR